MLIAIDFDGTIANTGVAKQTWLAENLGMKVEVPQCSRGGLVDSGPLEHKTYNEMLFEVCDREHTLAADQCSGAIEGVKGLAELGDLCVVSDRGRFERWGEWARQWLEARGILKLFGTCCDWLLSTEFYIDPDGVKHGYERSKDEICSDNEIAILIDDDVKNVTFHEAKHTRGLLYRSQDHAGAQPGDEVHVARSWDDIVAICRQLVAGGRVAR